MDLDREECLKVLEVLGVELPEETKLPLDVLQKRVGKALDCTQKTLRWRPSNPSELKKWKSSAEKTLLEATKTINMLEAFKNEAETLATGGKRLPPALFVDPFMDLRQSVMAFGMNCDKGLRVCSIEDPKGAHSFTMRVVEIYEVQDGVPLFLVLYEHGEGTRFSRKSASNFLDSQPQGAQGFLVHSNLLEQKLLLKLLQSNAKCLPQSYSIPKQPFESKHRLSWFVPPNPLGFHDIGSLTNDTGCIICGETTRSRCAQCQSVSYCSKECQAAHWKSHKLLCKSLTGGSWIPVNFSPLAGAGENFVGINKYTTTTDLKELKKNIMAGSNPDKDSVLPNIHGERAFIAKIQATLPWSQGDPSIQIYDRRRSLTVLVKKDVDPRAFGALFEVYRREGYMGSKIYRWVKRTEDWEFSVCMDRVPKGDIKW